MVTSLFLPYIFGILIEVVCNYYSSGSAVRENIQFKVGGIGPIEGGGGGGGGGGNAVTINCAFCQMALLPSSVQRILNPLNSVHVLHVIVNRYVISV